MHERYISFIKLMSILFHPHSPPPKINKLLNYRALLYELMVSNIESNIKHQGLKVPKGKIIQMHRDMFLHFLGKN